MRKTKENGGITLVALVVTIVVLLILAGVSINLVLGNSGIIAKAKEAKDETQLTGVKEKLAMIIGEYPMSPEYANMEDFLVSKIPNDIDSVTDLENGKLEVEKEGYIAIIDANGVIEDFSKAGLRPMVSNIKVVVNSNGTGENLPANGTDEGIPLYINFDHSIEGGTTTVSPSIPFKVTENGKYTFTVIGTVNEKNIEKTINITVNQYSSKYKIGDYVNYTYDTAADYILGEEFNGMTEQTISQASNLKWRILNIDENNNSIDLVSQYACGR